MAVRLTRLTRTTSVEFYLEKGGKAKWLSEKGDEEIRDFAKRFLKATKESLSEVHQTLQIQSKKMKGNEVLNTIHRNSKLKGN